MLSRRMIALVATAFFFYAVPSRAQDQAQAQTPPTNVPQGPIEPATPTDTGGATHEMPVPAARGLFGGDVQPTDTQVPDQNTTLTGAEVFGSGLPNGTHNILDVALHETTAGDTGIAPGETNLAEQVGAIASLSHLWNRFEFNAQYAGAEQLYFPATNTDSYFQDASIEQIIKWPRAILRLRDDFIQSPGATFGGLNTGGPGLTMPAGIIDTLSPTFASSESILTGQADRLVDTAVGEVDYELSHRSTLTFAASYGILHFLTSGYIDSESVIGRVGYSYELDRKNAVGLMYDYQRVAINGGIGTISSHVPAATYGRRITGQTTFQISAGPQLILSDVSATFIAPNQAYSHQLSWLLDATITHRLRRTIYSASYEHALGNGSGVLIGAEAHTFSGSISTTIFRQWTPTINGGYVLNSSLGSEAGNFQFSNWFAAVNIGRLWHRLVQTNFSYELQQQVETAGVCPVLNCGPGNLRQVFGVTVDWHIRPVGFE